MLDVKLMWSLGTAKGELHQIHDWSLAGRCWCSRSNCCHSGQLKYIPFCRKTCKVYHTLFVCSYHDYVFQLIFMVPQFKMICGRHFVRSYGYNHYFRWALWTSCTQFFLFYIILQYYYRVISKTRPRNKFYTWMCPPQTSFLIFMTLVSGYQNWLGTPDNQPWKSRKWSGENHCITLLPLEGQILCFHTEKLHYSFKSLCLQVSSSLNFS